LVSGSVDGRLADASSGGFMSKKSNARVAKAAPLQDNTGRREIGKEVLGLGDISGNSGDVSAFWGP